MAHFLGQFACRRFFRWFACINLSGWELQEIFLHRITELAHEQDIASRQHWNNGSATRMLKHFPKRVDSLIGGDFVDDQVDDPATIYFIATVQRVREFHNNLSA